MIADAEFLVVTTEFDVVVEMPYVTDGIVQRNVVEFGMAAVLTVMTRTPEALMLAIPAPRPPPQLTL